jgi:hypothetical protein
VCGRKLHRITATTEDTMSKPQHGNKEAKKPKQPAKPAPPQGMAPLRNAVPAPRAKR